MEYFTHWCIIVLLIIAILYALILNFRLSAFKKNGKEILKNIHSFNQTVQNAETTLSQLQKRTQNVMEQLKLEINQANQLRDDLVLILDKTTHTHMQTSTKPLPITYAKTNRNDSSKSDNKSLNLYQSDAEKELSLALQRLKEES